jgi:hypothetical protein
MPVKATLLTLAAILCFAAAYRFGSHGLRLHENQCVGYAVVAAVIGLVLLWFAFRNRRPLPK